MQTLRLLEQSSHFLTFLKQKDAASRVLGVLVLPRRVVAVWSFLCSPPNTATLRVPVTVRVQQEDGNLPYAQVHSAMLLKDSRTIHRDRLLPGPSFSNGISFPKLVFVLCKATFNGKIIVASMILEIKCLRGSVLLQRAWVWFPAPTRWLTAVFNFSWQDPLTSVDTYNACRYKCGKNTHVWNKQIFKSK